MQAAFRAVLWRTLLAAALAAAPVLASADVYKCAADGQTTTYSSIPCDNRKPARPETQTTQTTVPADRVSVIHYEPVQPKANATPGNFGLDVKDTLTIALMILIPVGMVMLMFMSRKSRTLTK